MTEAVDEISIPDKHVDFCRALARVAREFGVDSFSGNFTPGFKDPWHRRISFSWDQGRHGEDSDRLYITSEVQVHTRLGPEKETFR